MIEAIAAFALIALTAAVVVADASVRGDAGHTEPGERLVRSAPRAAQVLDTATTSAILVLDEPVKGRENGNAEAGGGVPASGGTPAILPAAGPAEGTEPVESSILTVPAPVSGVPLRPGGSAVDLLPKTAARNGESATIDLNVSTLVGDPDRLIQSEVIVPAEAERNPWAVVRLFAAIAGFGTLFGIGIVAAFQILESLLRMITGG